MVILKLFTYLLLVSDSFAKDILIHNIKVNCKKKEICTISKEAYQRLVGRYTNERDLAQSIEAVAESERKKLYSYFISLENDNTLHLNFDDIQILKSVHIVMNDSSVDFSPLIRKLKEDIGKEYQEAEVEGNFGRILDYLRDHGVGNSKIRLSKNRDGRNVELVYKVDASATYILDQVTLNFVDRKANNDHSTRKFKRLIKRKWNRLSFKTKVDELHRDYISDGYYYATLDTDIPLFNKDNSKVSVVVNINKGSRYSFEFFGNNIYSSTDLRNTIISKIKNDSKDKLDTLISSYATSLYEQKGYFFTKIIIRRVQGKDIHGNRFNNYHILIKEGLKNILKILRFSGNKMLSSQEIRSLYELNSSALASRGFLDMEYLRKFKLRLERMYFERGFIFVDISGPVVKMLNDRRESEVTFKIKERVRTKVKSIVILGIEESLEKKIKSFLSNKDGKFLNVIKLESDIEYILKKIRLEGYYFAKIKSQKKDDLVKYGPNFTEVEIEIKIESGRKVVYDTYEVVGLEKTKVDVIKREISFFSGELLTPEKVDELRSRLIGLGLFSFVKISPFIKNKYQINEEQYNKIHLFIQVKEKDFGLGEISPGYRTDLGMKLSTMISYNNLSGMNRLFSIKLQGNLRDSFRDLDSRRSRDQNKFIEYSAKFLYEEPYLLAPLLNTKVEFDMSTTYHKKRFFSFDANIAKVSPTISKSFSKYFSTSLQYQLESIEQKDATEFKDNGHFRIGSLIPSFFLDYRDSNISPRRGNYLAASWEFANDYFGSMKEEDLEVNYSKLVLRNKNYLSFGHFVLATSFAVGIEKNYATERRQNNGVSETSGYIPSIKVFRLEGNDSVRGFQNSEINRLESGDDIGQVVVDDKAYFVNFKLEPRYFVNDIFLVALFFDAGRVFVKSFSPLDLRSSFGLSLKVLTPVGSLNFDYGVKTRRKILSSGAQEGFGRFHLSIGFF